MNLFAEFNGLLARRDFKSIGDLLYLPNSSTRPSRENSRYLNVKQVNSRHNALPAPYQSLLEKFLTAVGLMQEVNAGAWSVANLQSILNSCREFFKYAVYIFHLVTTYMPPVVNRLNISPWNQPASRRGNGSCGPPLLITFILDCR